MSAVAPDKPNATIDPHAPGPALRARYAAGLVLLAFAVAVPATHAAQPPGAAAAELAANGKLEAALKLLDGWLADHPGDELLFPLVLGVVTAAPERTTVDAVLRRYQAALPADRIGVLRAVPADFAELRGSVEQALEELRLSRPPNADQRRAVLLLELGRLVSEAPPGGVPIALHAGLARSSEGLDEASLEASLRTAFSAPGQADGGAAGAVAGYGLVALLAGRGDLGAANSVLAELGSRYPRSPEYALAAADLRRSTALPSVVSLPSPTMLLGGVALVCRSPCTIPAAAPPQESPPPTARPASLAKVPEETAPLPSASSRRDQGTPPAELEPILEQIENAAPVVHGAAPATARDTGGRSRSSVAGAASEAENGGQPASVVAPGERVAASRSTPVGATASGRQPIARQAALTRPAAAAAMTAATLTVPSPALASEPAAGGGATTTAPAPRSAAGTVPRPATGRGTVVRVVSSPGPATSPTSRVLVSAQPATRPSSAGGVTVSARPQSPRVASAADASVTAAPVVGREAKPQPEEATVRVASAPDPAAFVVQVGVYVDPDNASEMEVKLRQMGFPAVARSYRNSDGSIVHRVVVGSNVTRAKAGQTLARLEDAGFRGVLSRRDVASYLPPPPPQH